MNYLNYLKVMKKLFLLFATVFCMAVTNAQDWNFVNSFATSTGRQHAVVFDGTYFYGCDAHSGKIWCYDLHNKTLVGTIETSLTELGTCTYDPVNDAFWVGERAAGSSPNLMLDLKLVNRNGKVIQSAPTSSR